MKLQGKNLRKHNLAINKYKIVTSFICLCTGLLLALPFFVSLAKSKDSAIFIERNIGYNNEENINPLALGACTTLNFQGPLFTVNSPRAIVASDLDKDGNFDLVTTNSNSNNISVLRNVSSNLALQFAPQMTFTVGNNPFSLAAGDLDGDSKPDLAVANFDSNSLSILRNTSSISNITFTTPFSIAVGTQPTSVAISDLDGDGKLDIVVSNLGNNSITILRNTSSASNLNFVSSSIIGGFGNNPRSIKTGDIDKDGKLDLVLANQTSNDVAVLRNTSTVGNITFATPINFLVGSTPVSVAIGDLDSDGNLDLAVANFNGKNVSILKNASTLGNISFLPQVMFSVETMPFSVVISNLDKDNKPDLAVTNNFSNSLSLLKNASSGGNITFAPQIVCPTGRSPIELVTNDLDKDNNIDLAIANNGTNSVLTLKNISSSGNLSFFNQINLIVGNNPSSSATGDLDGDGKLELVSSNANDNTVSILQNISTANNIGFNTQVIFPVGNNPFSVAVKDLDGDGKLDLAVANFGDNTVSVLRNTSTINNISFISQGTFNVGSTPRALSIADLDGDNKPEIIVANTGSNNISILLNISTIGNISFTPQLTFGVGSSPLSVMPGDLDGDGKADLAVSNFNGASLSILRNTSSLANITFATAITIFGFNNPVTVIQTDLTGDNKLDLAVTNFTSSTVSTLRNTSTIGNISFASQDTFFVGSSPFSIAAQDLDGDGKTDLVVSNNGDNSVSLLINTSTTTTSFAPQQIFLVGTNPNTILLADLDKNSTFDVITCNSGSNDLSVIKTTCCPVITIAPSLLPNAIAGVTYNQQLTATGGVSPYTFSFTGSLPSGLTLSNSGLLSGTTIQIGAFTITVMAQDANGCTGSTTVTLNVNAGTQNAVIFAADTSNNRIQKSTNEGTTWATVGFGAGKNVGQFNAPRSVVSDFTGQIIFVADTGNNRIQRSTNGGLGWTVIASAGVAIGTVNKPEAIAYDSINDKLYIADTLNNRIQIVSNAKTLNPIFSLFAGSKAGVNLGQFNQPSGIAVDLTGRVYVADTLNNRIQFNTDATSLGWSIFASATSGTTLGKVNAPRSIFVTSQNIVYVADTANNRIQVNNNGVSTGWSLFMGPGTMANTVNAPRGVTVTLMENVIIGDTGNNRVQRKPTIGGSAIVVGGPGLAVGQFNQPSGVR